MSSNDGAWLTLQKILNDLPHNRNRKFAQIKLEKGDCTVFFPIRDNLVHKSQEYKDWLQDLANSAGL